MAADEVRRNEILALMDERKKLRKEDNLTG